MKQNLVFILLLFYASLSYFLSDWGELWKILEWAKYSYGVFDEVGYTDDPVYPTCYHSNLKNDYQVNGCSDKDISKNGMCANGVLNIFRLVHPEAKTSLFFTDSHGVDVFCDETSHDRFAPTKHNNLRRRKSAMQIINEHSDFSNGSTLNYQLINTPTIIHKRESLTRYVLVIENTKDLIVRESCSYLRLAFRNWVVVELQGQVEVALISANETKATLRQSLTPINSTASYKPLSC